MKEYIVYRHDVCKIKSLEDNIYTLIPIKDDSLKITTPVDNKCLRDLVTKEEIDNILNNLKNIKILDNVKDRVLENTYKELLNKGSFEDLFTIIKTSHYRNSKRIENKKKISEKDSYYFNLAESYLYNEFAIVLNKTFDETKEYVISYLKN